MPVEVLIRVPSALRRFTEGADELNVEAASVIEALQAAADRYPPLGRHLFSASGELRSFMRVFLNARDIQRLAKAATSVQRGDVITLVPAIAGG